MEGYQWGCGGENMGKGTGDKKHKWQVENRQGEVKNSIRNREAKELIYTAHGYELKVVGWILEGGGCTTEGDKGEKKLGQL